MRACIAMLCAALALGACASPAPTHSAGAAGAPSPAPATATLRLNEDLTRKNESYLAAAQEARRENERLKAQVALLEAKIKQLTQDLERQRSGSLSGYRPAPAEPGFTYEGRTTQVDVDASFSPNTTSVRVDPR